jgi:hypothetical protein
MLKKFHRRLDQDDSDGAERYAVNQVLVDRGDLDF